MQKRRAPGTGPNYHAADRWVYVRTIGLVAAFLIFGFGLLIYQLYVLQLRDSAGYRAQAAQQQLSDEILPATRGSIYSATGRLLAKSNVMWNVIAVPASVTEEGEAYLNQASQDIAAILNDGTTPESILQSLTAANPTTGEKYEYRVLATDLDMPTADALIDYADNLRLPVLDDKGNPRVQEDGQPLKGSRVITLYTERTSTRSYPYGAFMASILGFCDDAGTGIYGLESSYNEQLAGTPGRALSSRSQRGYELTDGETETFPAIDGYNLNLTIDENVQTVLENYLSKAIEDFDVHNRACAIVMEVKTGAIKGMASIGQFDPNDPFTIYDEQLRTILDNGLLDGNTTAILQDRLGEDEVADIVVDGQIDDSEYSRIQGMMREAQWKNKNLTELYHPGSVFKLVTASSALDSGLMTPAQTFNCSGSYVVNAGTAYEHSYGCALDYVHGTQNLGMALNNSCNIYFIQVGQLLSPHIFYDYIQAFGFTEPTGIDLPNETRWMLVYDGDAMEEINTNLYSAAFGQNMAITPMQMATAVAAVTNGGYLVTPYVVDTVTDNAGNIIQRNTTRIRRQVISEEVSAELRAMMEENVGHGDTAAYHSCRNAYVAGYRIGGKSGTAEKLGQSAYGDRYAMSFAAVLPADDPELLVFVMLDDPHRGGKLASQLVVPIVGNIISEVAPYLGIERSPDYTPDGDVLVAECVGKSWTDAQVALNVQGMFHQIIGPSGTIVYQYPAAGTYAPAGSTVYLYTESAQGQGTTVPDATGKTGSFAVQMLKAAGLNAQLVGDANDRVVAQDIAPESGVEMGTIITVTTAPAEPAPEEAAAEEVPPEESEDTAGEQPTEPE